jgi:hypothetical protein
MVVSLPAASEIKTNWNLDCEKSGTDPKLETILFKRPTSSCTASAV